MVNIGIIEREERVNVNISDDIPQLNSSRYSDMRIKTLQSSAFHVIFFYVLLLYDFSQTIDVKRRKMHESFY